MFRKLMNSYYYGKSGKGDYTKEDLPTTRMQLFWEMLRIRFSGLVRLNLMYVIAWIPAILVLFISVFNMVSLMAEVAADPGILNGTSLQDALSGMMLSMLITLIPCLLITGPVTTGVCYVTRNWARDEHAFVWSDFKDAIKENWKQALPVSVITALMPALVYVCWVFYGAYAKTNAVMMVPQLIVVFVGILWSLMLTYIYPMIVTYELKLGGILRNALLLAIGRLPASVGIRLLHCVPAALAALLVFVLGVPFIYVMLGLMLYYIIFGFSFSRFITASYTNAVFDKYINSRLEGVEINKGLQPEAEDEDDDE